MIINLQQLPAFFPASILIFTIFTVMLSISYNRNHFFIALCSVIGCIISFISLYFLTLVIPVEITSLFRVNGLSVLYISMVLIASISTCIFSYPWLKKYFFNKEEFYLLILFSTLGAISLIISNHMSSFFINLELLSLPIFGLIAYSSDEKYSLEAAFKYIILSGIASSFLLLGIAWIYSISGDLNFIAINKVFAVASFHERLVVLFGISMILISLFFKLSVVPFHLSVADLYQGTPASVLSFFSTVSKISVFSVLLHFLSHLCNPNNKVLFLLILLITISSMFIGNLMALFQNNIKRLFGYLSISQLGYLFIVFLVSDKNYLFALETSGIYLCGYLFSNIAFFGIISLISNEDKNNCSNIISSYQGLFWSHPCLSIILTFIMLSSAGIPITLGFIGKFYILSIIINEHLYLVGLFFLISTILGMYCYLKVIIRLYLNPSNIIQENLNISKNWFYTPSGVVILFSGLILLIFGLYPTPLINLIRLFIFL